MSSSRSSRPSPRAGALTLLAVGAALAVLAPAPTRAVAPQAEPAASFAILERVIAQDQGHWLVAYKLRHEGATGLVVTPSEVVAQVEALVSNSKVPGHSLPRASSLVVSGGSGSTAVAELIAAPDESRRCRERAVLTVWTGEDPEPPPPPPAAAAGKTRGARKPEPQPEPARPILSIGPGATVRVRLRLEHQHVVHGDYDPLLGVRQLELRLGAAVLRDTLPLDHEQYHAVAVGSWPEPPADRRDPRIFLSAPDSLHLEAHIPGNGYYRFPERPVRYGTRMRLRFWYLVAPGTEGECRARLAQYKETPTSWKALSDGCIEEPLGVVGRWVKVERVFRTESEATTLALDFRIVGAEQVGELWVDDVSLEPVHDLAAGP